MCERQLSYSNGEERENVEVAKNTKTISMAAVRVVFDRENLVMMLPMKKIRNDEDADGGY